MKSIYMKRISLSGLTALLAYVLFISWRLFFYAYSNNFRDQMTSIRYNLIPFKTIIRYVSHAEQIGFEVWIYNLAGNIAAFMPLGFLLPMTFKGMRAGKAAAASFAMIFLAEVLQLISRRGVFDVDDLLLNMLGSMIGYGIYKIIYTIVRRFQY